MSLLLLLLGQTIDVDPTPPTVAGIFTPPTDNIVPPVYLPDDGTGADLDGHYADSTPAMTRLMRHYVSRPRGRNIFLMYDGSVSEVQPANWNPADPTGPFVSGHNPITNVTDSTSLPASQQVRKVFWGGCSNPITADEQAILVAAGYGPNIT